MVNSELYNEGNDFVHTSRDVVKFEQSKGVSGRTSPRFNSCRRAGGLASGASHLCAALEWTQRNHFRKERVKSSRRVPFEIISCCILYR